MYGAHAGQVLRKPHSPIRMLFYAHETRAYLESSNTRTLSGSVLAIPSSLQELF